MKINNVNIRVERVNTEGVKVDEVFITCENPYINICLHFTGDSAGQLESGTYTMSFESGTAIPAVSAPVAAPVKEVVKDGK